MESYAPQKSLIFSDFFFLYTVSCTAMVMSY